MEVQRSGTTAARATQVAYDVRQDDKAALLLALLEGGEDSTLVFTRTKRIADKVAKQLQKAGFSAERIHADRSQGQRRAALDGFKTGKFRVLVATDIAARGIDVDDIGHVVNFDLPHVPEDYVHRIGRTARAAASGHASSFVSSDAAPLLRDIEKLIKAPLPKRPLPEGSALFQQERARMSQVRAQQPTPRASAPRGGGGGRGQARGGGGGGGPRRGGGGGGGGNVPNSGSWRPRRGR